MYNQQFLDAPQQFASDHTLYPVADPVVNQGQMKTLALSDGSSFTQVGGENKVAWCNIEPASRAIPVPADLGGSYGDDRDLYVMRVSYRQSGNAFPVYYLPWAPDEMFRIKLKPSRKHPTETGFIWTETVEPAVFITAALQGCSIIASGDPQEPVLYHLNASGTDGPHGETLGSNNDNDIRIAAYAKRDEMLRRYNLARAEQPKEGVKTLGARPPQTFTSQSAHLTDYMHGMLGSINTAITAKYLSGAAGEVAQFGTVFGIRSGGSWKFYRQTRTRVCRFAANPKDDVSTWVDPVCVRFWP